MLKFVRFILSPLTFLYKYIIGIRNFLFDKNIFKESSVNAKVISVGNLTIGGSGKTPMVLAIAKYLKNDSRKVGVLSRGYGRNTKGYKLVSDGKNILLDVNDAGDEIFLVANECKIPAAVCEKRVEGTNKLIKETDVDIIVLDDAFQHRWINRDFDILVIDQRFLSNVNSFDQRLLPLGSMREPFESVERADVVVINRKFSPKITVPNKIKKFLLNKDLFYSYYIIDGIYDIKTDKKYSVEEFEGQHSLVVCGIARPFSFLTILTENNINIKNKLTFTDHKEYTSKEIQTIRKKFYGTNSHSVLTTHKDAVKLMEFNKELDDIEIFYLKIELKFEDENKFYELVNTKI